VALIAAFVLALLNAVLRPLLILLTIPVTIFTLGLFLLVINTVMLMIADQLVDGFVIRTFWAAFFLSLFISFMNAIIGGNVRVEKHSRNDF
jgi:putative membrane protein